MKHDTMLYIFFSFKNYEPITVLHPKKRLDYRIYNFRNNNEKINK